MKDLNELKNESNSWRYKPEKFTKKLLDFMII